jgi:hypothetical protein
LLCVASLQAEEEKRQCATTTKNHESTFFIE